MRTALPSDPLHPGHGARASRTRSGRAQLVKLEALLKAVADPTRLRIIGLLRAGEVCVCHIHESLGVPQPKASRHLAYLRRAGVVAARKDGLWVHYRLAELADPVTRAVLEAVAHATGHLQIAEHDRQRLCMRQPLLERNADAPTTGCCPGDGAAASCCGLAHDIG